MPRIKVTLKYSVLQSVTAMGYEPHTVTIGQEETLKAHKNSTA